MKITLLKSNVGQVDGLPKNPRFIRDDKFQKLVKSVETFPEMMRLRPIVYIKHNGSNVVIGGNMRLKALQELGFKDVPDEWIKDATDLTPEKRKEFVIKDNASFGSDDWDELANNWDAEELNEWGLDVWNPDDIDLDEFFKEDESDGDDNKKNKIVLEYTEEDYEKVCAAFDAIDGSKESIVWNLLNLE